MVMGASSRPDIQSSSLTGGNIDCSVGPGVGRALTTVHPGGGESPASSSSVEIEVSWAASVFTGVSSGASVLCTDSVSFGFSVATGVLLWQAAKIMAMNITKISKRFISSLQKYLIFDSCDQFFR
jgi:hypothetical protein